MRTAVIEDRAAELIDLDFYSTQSRHPFSCKKQALKHFITTGQAMNIMPHPLFHTKWFKWQNPDHTNQPSILHEFLTKSEQRIVDPGPMIDMFHFMQRSKIKDPVHAIRVATEKRWCPADGVYRDFSDLVHCQNTMRKSIVIEELRALPPPRTGQRRKNLLWLQIGPHSQFVKWFKPELSRNWDLLVNWYSPEAIDPALGDGALLQRGTKFTAVAEVWKSRPDMFDDYRRVLFFDDDLILAHHRVNTLFDIAEKHQLDVFQPALTKHSHGAWPVFRQKSQNADWRKTNGVEIMMPGFSKRALWHILPLFTYTMSGFGLDFLFSKIVRDRKFTCGVIDRIPVIHAKEINQVSGEYYNFLRRFGINSKAELWYLVEAFSLDFGFYEE